MKWNKILIAAYLIYNMCCTQQYNFWCWIKNQMNSPSKRFYYERLGGNFGMGQRKLTVGSHSRCQLRSEIHTVRNKNSLLSLKYFGVSWVFWLSTSYHTLLFKQNLCHQHIWNIKQNLLAMPKCHFRNPN